MRNESLAGLARGTYCIVEVGSDWVKVAKVRNGTVELVAAAEFDAVKGDGSDVLRTLVGEHRLTGLPSVALVPRQSVNIRMLELPSQDVSEIRDMVDLQATKQTPYSREEVLLDYSAAASDRPGYTHAVLVIVQRSVLRHRYYMLEEAGLRLVQMSVSSEALVNWTRLAVPAPEGVVAVLNVDSGSSEVAIVGPSGLLFSRGIQTGADDLAGGEAGVSDRLVEEVKRGMDVVRGEVRDLAIGRLVVTGAVRPDGGILERLSEVLGVPCLHRESLSVARGMTSGAVQPSTARFSLAALAGAASSPSQLSFNLIPESVLARQTVTVRGRQLAGMVALLIACLVLASLSFMVRYVAGRERLRSLEEAFEARRPAAERTERRREVIEVVQRRQAGRALPLEMLREITQVVAQGVSLDAVDVNKAQGLLAIAGTAQSMKDIRGIVSGLEQSPLFCNVREGNATTLDKSQRYRFQLVASLEAFK